MSAKPTKIKPTDKILEFLKTKYFSPLSYIDTPTLSLDDMKKLSLDSEVEINEVGSFVLTKSTHFLWGASFKLEIKNNDIDLDGRKTEDNNSLLNFLLGEYRRKNLIIKATDLRDFNVNTKRSEIRIANFKLTESIVGGLNSLFDGKVEKSFDLNLADKRFGADNKIINSKITFKEIQRVMSSFKLKQADYDSNGEVAINKLLETHFQSHF